MVALMELPPWQTAALTRALRIIAASLRRAEMPPETKPFDVSAELDVLRSAIEQLLDEVSIDSLNRMLAVVGDRKGMAAYPPAIARIEAALYREALTRRGVRQASAHPVRRAESDQARLQTSRFVIGSLTGAMPDDTLIGANRRAYDRYLELEPLAGDPEIDTERDALAEVMNLLGTVMDTNGATDRYVAGLPAYGGRQ